jgi:hypothetical protein
MPPTLGGMGVEGEVAEFQARLLSGAAGGLEDGVLGFRNVAQPTQYPSAVIALSQ